MTPARREELCVLALALLPPLLFLDAAVSIDAPVFVAVARRILEAPLDPYGFRMIWDPTSPEAASFDRNPPLLSYWLAPWIALFGEHEVALHAALLPFTALAAGAFLGCARRLAGSAAALPAALWLVCAPAFAVLATTLMLDVPVLAALLVGVHCLLRGHEGGRLRWFWAAGVAAACAGLLKYVGFAALPLLAAGACILLPAAQRRGALLRIATPPLVAWGLFAAWTAALYGEVHFLGSTDVVIGRRLDPHEIGNQIASTPVYYGGALLFPFFAALGSLRSARGGAEWGVACLLVGTALAWFVLPEGAPPRRNPIDSEELVFAALACAAALCVWGRLGAEALGRRDPESRFLLLWSGGFLAFTLGVNWHVNAADALLAAPPALLLLFRSEALRPARRGALALAAPLLALSLLLAWADALQAGFYRDCARRAAIEIGAQPGARWLVGHWGLQHYFGALGFEPVVPPTYGRSDFEVDDWIASARNVSQLDVSRNLGEVRLREVASWELRHWLPLRTTNADASAGFYSHHSGYVPFAWSRAPFERVQLGRVIALRRIGAAARPGDVPVAPAVDPDAAPPGVPAQAR